MRIKTQDGEFNVASQGQGTLNTVLGAIGTAAALGFGTGLFGRGNRDNRDEGDRPVTRYEMGLIKESLAKDNEIVLLKSQQYTDKAMFDVQAQFGKQLAWNAAQQVHINTIEMQLGQITKLVVPITAIDPVPTTSSTQATTTTTTTPTQG